MLTFLAKLFGTHRPADVDEAIRALLKAETDLATVEDDRRTSVHMGETLIVEVQAQVDADTAEADRAKAIANMLKAITNPISSPEEV